LGQYLVLPLDATPRRAADADIFMAPPPPTFVGRRAAAADQK
jgi:hypothetical protein